jgi:hypothetical protein
MASSPNAAASGMVARSTVRARSLTIKTGHFRHRSSQAPAGSPTRAKASVAEPESSPSSNGLASSVSTASSGSATPLTWAPSWLVVWPKSNRRKSR